jgi:hypothetical protein
MPESLAAPLFAGFAPRPLPETHRKIAFDHRNDHRQRNFQKAKIKYPGVAQLVARVVWDHQAAGSNPVTRTKNPLKSSISEDFSMLKVQISDVVKAAFFGAWNGLFH